MFFYVYTSTAGGRNRTRTSSDMASVDQVHELQETVGQLEATLSTTRDTVKLLQEALNARETEIQQLRKKLKGQEGLLLRRMQIISETKKERDDLRRKNAELILKQAEVGRKHSVNASPPRLRQVVHPG